MPQAIGTHGIGGPDNPERQRGDGVFKQPVVNRPVADELHSLNSADAIGAQDAILPHNSGLSAKDGTSINQFVTTAVAEKVSALETPRPGVGDVMPA